MNKTPRITRIGGTKDQLGESPVWDERTQSLYWIDSLAGVIRKLSPASGVIEEFKVPAPIGSFALTQGSGAVMAQYDFRTHELTMGPSIDVDHPMVRLND